MYFNLQTFQNGVCKKLAHFQNGVSVLGRILEQGIKNWPISRTGYQFLGKFFLKRGANLESRAAHIHPKNTQVPPRGYSYLSMVFPYIGSTRENISKLKAPIDRKRQRLPYISQNDRLPLFSLFFSLERTRSFHSVMNDS